MSGITVFVPSWWIVRQRGGHMPAGPPGGSLAYTLWLLTGIVCAVAPVSSPGWLARVSSRVPLTRLIIAGELKKSMKMATRFGEVGAGREGGAFTRDGGPSIRRSAGLPGRSGRAGRGARIVLQPQQRFRD